MLLLRSHKMSKLNPNPPNVATITEEAYQYMRKRDLKANKKSSKPYR